MKKKLNDVYLKLDGHTGIYKHVISGQYQARKKVNGEFHKKTFKSLREATSWWRLCNGKEDDPSIKSATLKDVWSYYQEHHFPTLADSTKQIWVRRYELLSQLQDYEMHKITPSVISSWVEKNVSFYKSSEYEDNSRGHAKRCNLDNELNLMTTIFNWYKSSEFFEVESQGLSNPVKTHHKKLGFVRTKIKIHKAISLDDATTFFNYLSPLYRDLAMFQFYTASRIGEVAGLQWNRVNFDRREILIMETCQWCMSKKTFIKLNPHPKSREPRPAYMTDELYSVLKRMEAHKYPGSNFVFHVLGKPLNYGTILLNYREAQRKGRIPCTGTHILRHGMASLARKVGGGLDAVIAMTGHKDLKLADHYSKLGNDHQKEVSQKIMAYINSNGKKQPTSKSTSNILQLVASGGKS
jgi:integrase